MSKRSKKSKASPLGGKKNQHITRISASSSHRDSEASPRNTDEIKSKVTQTDANEVIPETVITDDGKTAIRPADNTELNQPEKPKAVKKLTRAERKALKKAGKPIPEREIKSYFILFRPFVRFGRYLRDSWREIRQVRWPNRKATWKMTLAVLVYVALFMIFLTLIDVFFTFIFDLIFKK